MIPALVPTNEKDRLHALHAYDLRRETEDNYLDNIVKLASTICKVPIALVSIVDSQTNWGKTVLGFPAFENPREITFCAHAILQNEPMIVPDSLKDVRFWDSQYVTGEKPVRFYAGVQLQTEEGYNLGTLCVVDHKPNSLDQEQLFALKVLSESVMNYFDLRLKLKKSTSANKDLEEKNAMQRKILSVISHDLRSPINSLRSVFQLEEFGVLTAEDYKSMLSDAHNRLQSAETLMNDVFSWASAHINNHVQFLDALNMEHLFNEHKKVFSPLFAEKNITFLLKNSLVSDNIIVDTKAVHFVVRNFIANAIKFTPNEGTITIALEKHAELENTYILSVQDTGVGISPETMDKLFNWNERYFQIGTAGEKGTGIGLLLCRDFARKSGGDVFLESTVGKGTKACFLFSSDTDSLLLSV